MDIYEILNKTVMEEYEASELTEKEKKAMKKNFYKNFKKGHKKYYALAAVAVISQTALAQSLVNGIIETFTTGNNKFYKIDMPETEQVPEEYKGIFFDKDGKPVDELKKGEAVYNAKGEMLINEKGEKVVEYVDEDGYTIINEDGTEIAVLMKNKSKDEIAEGSDDKHYVETDISKLADKLNFEPALPSYLPESYKFYGALLYKNEDGAVSGDYLAAYYKSSVTGKTFSVHERVINEETAFETGTSGKITETKLKGHSAVIMDNSSVDWEENGISVSVLARESGISADELIRIAESAAGY